MDFDTQRQVCIAGDDSGLDSVAVPAGQADATSTPVRPVLVWICNQNFGPALLNVSLADAGVNSTVTTNAVVWIIDMMHQATVSDSVHRVVKERRCYIGSSLIDIPVTVPFRLSIAPLDSAEAMTVQIAWRVERQSTNGRPNMSEIVVRRVLTIGPGGSVPTTTVIGNDLLFPIGSELQAGLITPDISGFGWRPDVLTVRKTAAADSITLWIASCAQVGGIPQFGQIVLGVGVGEWTGNVDPSWSGGLIIENNTLNVVSDIILIWKKS